MGVKASKLSRAILSLQSLRCPSSLMTPRGYIPVAVGANDENPKRFVVHTTALCDAEFMEFLCRSAEEYEFCNEGVLRIPYDAKAFEEWMMTRSDHKHKIVRVQPTVT